MIRPAHLSTLVSSLLTAVLLFTAPRAEAQAREPAYGAHIELEAAPATARRTDRSNGRVGRVLSGLGLGVAGTLAVGALGMGIGAAVDDGCVPGTYTFFCVNDTVTGAAVGAVIGVGLFPLLYTLGAELAGGDGHAGGAYLGFLVGSAAAAGMISLGVLANDLLRDGAGGALLGTSIVLGALMPIVGTVIGYELTHAAAPPMMPTVAIDGSGASIGLAGAF